MDFDGGASAGKLMSSEEPEAKGSGFFGFQGCGIFGVFRDLKVFKAFSCGVLCDRSLFQRVSARYLGPRPMDRGLGCTCPSKFQIWFKSGLTHPKP